MKNLLTQCKLRRKTDSKPEPWRYCFFLAFWVEPLSGRPRFHLVLRDQAVGGQTIVGRDRRGWPETLLRSGAKPLWVEDIRIETGRDKVLFNFQQGQTANAGSPVFLLSHQGDRSPANVRLLPPLWKPYWFGYLPSVLYFLISSSYILYIL